jgi:G3E family GTPase
MLRHHFDVERLVVTVDALNGAEELAAHPEARKQVLVADELVVTKIDLVSPEQCRATAATLHALNPAAELRTALHGVLDPQPLEPGAAARSTAVEADAPGPSAGRAGHTDDVASLTLRPEGPVDWLGFAVWLSMLLHARGEDVLRVKGIVELGDGTLVSVNGVQHVVHMPEHLEPGAAADPTSNVVFITRGIEIDSLRRSFETFQRFARATDRITAG